MYASVDKEFVEPLAKQFEKETGLEVLLVSDTEKAKSSGLLNRLIEEKDRPQCDVFLSEDPVRSAVLKRKGISAPYQSPSAKGLLPEYSDPEHHWTGMSARVRVLLVNMKHPLFKTEPFPTSVYDLVNPRHIRARPALATRSLAPPRCTPLPCSATSARTRPKNFLKA